MGNQLLKKLVVSIGIGSALTAGPVSTAKIDELVRQIKEPRKGIDAATIAKTYDPFIYTKKKVIKILPPKKKVIHLELKAIVNKKAKINGKWLAVGDTIKGYKLVKVSTDGVVLRAGNKRKILRMKQKTTHKIQLLQVKE